MEDKIDVVITWVDGEDKEWQKERNKYAGKDPEDTADYRYRDMGTLKYLFRGIEKYMPWVNNVFFVTNGQKPDWLNLDCPKLKWVKHEDYIPKEYLPTFSSHPIELNLHRIKELSDKFIYFNDDTFVINNIKKEWFFKNGCPCYIAGVDIAKANGNIFQNILFNNMQLIHNEGDKKKVVLKNFCKFYNLKYRFGTIFKTFCLSPFSLFSILRVCHMPNPLIKADIENAWKKYQMILEEVSSNKFRSKNDVNQYIISWSRILKGNFKPANERLFYLYGLGSDKLRDICNDIKKQNHKIICINDEQGGQYGDFESVKKELINSFEYIFPNKSIFEK